MTDTLDALLKDPSRIARGVLSRPENEMLAEALPTLLQRIRDLEEGLRPFANSDIDVSGTAAIGVTSQDIRRAYELLLESPKP